ncbi:hypothetical protein [Jongsikchunia kroppenstedtii]|uniref:hypothetical protein n=1 Tax=Jongsikchunia kroppenstedtii TaxID=1121721 RepID=UPI00036082E6|nr:hypothetical protein [Jongsikchunia kroppenstedtii]
MAVTTDTSADTPTTDDTGVEAAPVAHADAGDTKTSSKERATRRIADSGRKVGDYQISLKTMAAAALAVALIAVAAVSIWMWVDKSDQLDAMKSTAAGNAHAEQVATDYAVGAAQMDYQKINDWQARLTKGTSPELANRLTQAATSMQQIIAPLQWSSTSTPISAKVRSESGGVYVVDTFVNVVTKNTQAPDGVQSTATYSVTIDRNHNWLITNVGGIGAMLGNGGTNSGAPAGN